MLSFCEEIESKLMYFFAIGIGPIHPPGLTIFTLGIKFPLNEKSLEVSF